VSTEESVPNYYITQLANNATFNWSLDSILSQIQEADWILIEDTQNHFYYIDFHEKFSVESSNVVSYLKNLQNQLISAGNLNPGQQSFVDLNLDNIIIRLYKIFTDLDSIPSYSGINPTLAVAIGLRNTDSIVHKLAIDYPVDPTINHKFIPVPVEEFNSYPHLDYNFQDNGVYITNRAVPLRFTVMPGIVVNRYSIGVEEKIIL